uniref:SUZ domain-containing protein n=2 Tax=Parascaris univalens TaxID=6257 RepID=A0A915B343_PARUN
IILLWGASATNERIRLSLLIDLFLRYLLIASSSVLLSRWAMSDSHTEQLTTENVAESWEEAGDEVSIQLEQRQKELLKKKHKDEEMRAIQEAAVMQQLHTQQQCSSLGGDKQASIKILRRPQSYGTLPSSSKIEPSKPVEQLQRKQKSLEERQAAYQQARERIFGKFSPEEETESEADLGPTLVPLPPTTVNSPTGMLQPRMQFSAPVPRPRAPVAALRTIRAPHFQPIPACQGIVYSMPPPLSVYGPMQQQQQQRLSPTATSLGSGGLKPRQIPFYDSRVPPPFPLTVFPTSNAGVNGQTRPPNPVPYGRPPVQLLSQSQFSSNYNTSTNPNY